MDEEVRVKYKRSNATKNYNQLLLEMYKNDADQSLGRVEEEEGGVVVLEVGELGHDALEQEK